MRSVTLIAVSIAAGFGPVSAFAGGVWQTDPKSACAVWDAAPVPDETIGWTGGCKDGRASGPGVLTIFRAGKLVERSEGEFLDGKQGGHGSRDYPNGRYVGTFKDGLFEGEGSFVGADGMDYTGEWKSGNFDGFGTLSFPSGIRYEGHFRANTFNGFGSMVRPDGSRYDGEYLMNTPHGTGTYRSADGSIYAGQWNHGCFRQGNRTTHLGVPAEDCGLSDQPSASVAAAPASRDRREN
jgi:hypothetical protein